MKSNIGVGEIPASSSIFESQMEDILTPKLLFVDRASTSEIMKVFRGAN